jgi:hypothetical protein
MNAYFFKMNKAERNEILDQHRQVYDGFVTTYGQQINQQPLYVQDYANDKGGITVNNKGEVKSYTNMRINEMKHDGISTGLFSDEEDEYTYMTPTDEEFNGLDQIGDGDDDLAYGTMDDEDTDEVEYHIDVEIDEDYNIYDEIEEDMVESLQEQINKSLDMFKRFSKF